MKELLVVRKRYQGDELLSGEIKENVKGLKE